MPTTISSETSSPRAMTSLARRPIGVPAATAARNMSPVANWGIPSRSTTRTDCVPFPAPGGPSRIILMVDFSPPCGALGGRLLILTSTGAPELRLFDQPLVLMSQKVAVDLSHGVHRHGDDDQQRGPAKIKRQSRIRDEKLGQKANDGQIGRPDHG